MNTKYIIYGLIDPRTEEIRYIGKSTSGLARPRGHLKPSKYNTENNYKAHWIKSLMDQGISPIIIVLKSTENPEELSKMEIDTIAEYRNRGARLTNLTDGGEGSLGWEPSEENRKNMSAGRKKFLETLTEPLKAVNKKEHVFINGVECKECSDCKETLSINHFSIDNKSWDKLKKVCKVCNAKRTAEYRQANPTKKLTEEELKASYAARKEAMAAGVKKAHQNNPELAQAISARNSKAIEGTNVITGEKIFFNSALEAKAAGFQNSNIGQAIKLNKPYRGYTWRFI